MGGSQSQEFMVYTDAGEDRIASCPICGYAANVEKATSRLDRVENRQGDDSPREIATPNQRTIQEVGAFLGVLPQQQMKAMAYIGTAIVSPGGKTEDIAIAAFLRGDHTLNESKLLSLGAFKEVRPMTAEEIEKWFNAPAGFLGPVELANVAEPYPDRIPSRVRVGGFRPEGFPPILNEAFHERGKDKLYLILDKSIDGRKNMIAGANSNGFHLDGVTQGRDFTPTLTADFRNVNEGEGCPTPDCAGELKLGKAVEVGHIFKLGRKYAGSMGARVLDRNGKEVTPIMGSYGIGVERILTAAIEQAAAAVTDERAKGSSFALPASIAPFQVVVTITNIGDAALLAAGGKIAADLATAGVDVLLDDRDERAGVKFKDADLVGIPYRINVGKKLAEGKVELVNRLAGTSDDLATEGVAEVLQHILI